MSEKRIGEPVTILSVKAKPKGKGILVVLSTGEKLILSADTFTEFRLYPGKTLSDEELASIMSYADVDAAYVYAARRLSRESYSSAQIRAKLTAKGYTPQMIDKVTDRLLQTHLLDDQRFAKTFAEDVGELRLIGHHRILYELRVKGIGEDIIAALSFPPEKELEKAINFAKTLDHRYARVPHNKRVLKIDRALLARGFDEDIANRAARECAGALDPEAIKEEIEKAFAIAYTKYSRKYTGYDLSRRIYAYLIHKGFPYEEVRSITEEHDI